MKCLSYFPKYQVIKNVYSKKCHLSLLCTSTRSLCSVARKEQYTNFHVKHTVLWELCSGRGDKSSYISLHADFAQYWLQCSYHLVIYCHVCPLWCDQVRHKAAAGTRLWSYLFLPMLLFLLGAGASSVADGMLYHAVAALQFDGFIGLFWALPMCMPVIKV